MPESHDPENDERVAAESENDEREARGAENDGYREWTRELLRFGNDIGRMRPAPELSSNMRGMPMVMRALLVAKAPMSPSELARAAGVTDARIANILRTLEQKGLVTRTPAEHDRRRVEVSVTEKGREVSRRHFDEALVMVEDFLREMGEQDARDFVRVVGRVRDVMATRREEGREFRPPDTRDMGC